MQVKIPVVKISPHDLGVLRGGGAERRAVIGGKHVNCIQRADDWKRQLMVYHRIKLAS